MGVIVSVMCIQPQRPADPKTGRTFECPAMCQVEYVHWEKFENGWGLRLVPGTHSRTMWRKHLWTQDTEPPS